MTFAALRVLLRRNEGAAAIEFALIAPVLLLLFAGLANLGLKALEEARLHQVTRETAEAALYTQDLDILDARHAAAIAELGTPFSGSAYSGDVALLCLCPSQNPIENCSVAQATLCPATGLPWEIVIQVMAQMTYGPILPGFGSAETLRSVLRVQIR